MRKPVTCTDLSPLQRTDSTVAPPLTWIVALSAGLPLITTRALDTEELLTDGRSALLSEDYQSLEAWLVKEPVLRAKVRSMRDGARSEFLRRFNMAVVGAEHLRVYTDLLTS